MAFQVQAVAIGWEVYALTGRALDLGLLGLAQFLPMLLLTLLVGQAADRYDRRLIVAARRPLPRPVRGAARRRHRAAADLRARHPRDGAVGARRAPLRAGVTAALFGVVPAVLIGGAGTIAVAAVWMALFPELRRVRAFDA